MENKNNEQEKENEVKEPALKYGYISPDEYLRKERDALYKSEYFNGHVEAMAGASRKHARINLNIIGETYLYLKGKDCETFLSDLRIVSPHRESYTYPDMTIVCNEPKMEDEEEDSLTNPVVIIEVLSKSTGKYDIGDKFLYYQTIPSLKEYILIDSTKRYAKTIRKQSNGEWKSDEVITCNGKVTIKTIGFTLSFDSIYRRTSL